MRKLSYLISYSIGFFINLKIYHCLIRQFITPMFSLYSASSYWKTGNTLHNLLARCTAQLADFAYWTCTSVHVNTHHYSIKYPKSNYLFSEVIDLIYRRNTATVTYSTQGEISQKTYSVLEWPKQKIFWWTFFSPSTLLSFCSPNTAWNRMRSTVIFLVSESSFSRVLIKRMAPSKPSTFHAGAQQTSVETL